MEQSEYRLNVFKKIEEFENKASSTKTPKMTLKLFPYFQTKLTTCKKN